MTNIVGAWKAYDEAVNKARQAFDEFGRIAADVFDELAERGRFDEDGGYLSDEDWADSQCVERRE